VARQRAAGLLKDGSAGAGQRQVKAESGMSDGHRDTHLAVAGCTPHCRQVTCHLHTCHLRQNSEGCHQRR